MFRASPLMFGGGHLARCRFICLLPHAWLATLFAHTHARALSGIAHAKGFLRRALPILLLESKYFVLLSCVLKIKMEIFADRSYQMCLLRASPMFLRALPCDKYSDP